MPRTRLGSMTRAARWRAEALLFDVCAGLTRAMSPALRERTGAALGRLTWALDRRHVRVATANLLATPGLAGTPGEARAIAMRSFRHFGIAALDLLAFGADADPARAAVPIHGLAHARAALEKGRGALVFSGHLGMWEFASLVGGLAHPMSVVARPIDNPWLERRVASLRSRWGNRVIAKRGAVDEVVADLRAGRAVAMLIDQRPKSGGMVLPFLGRDAHVSPALALIALRTRAPILPSYCRRDARGAWQVVIEPEIPVQPTWDSRSDVRAIMTACNARLETWIRETPEQWLWGHARWQAPKAKRRARRSPVGTDVYVAEREP